MAKKYWTYKGKKIPVKKYKPKTEKTNEQLYRELVRKTGQANKKLRIIRNEYDSLGWAGSKLKEKTEFHLIDTWRNSKGIRVNKNMSEVQMKATLHELNKFLNSKTSTIKGIEEVMKKQQKTLRKTFEQYGIELTPEESKSLWQLFDDPDYSVLYQYIDPSELAVLIYDAKEVNASLEDFIRSFVHHSRAGFDIVDLDLRETLIALYNRWVR
jgi:sulfite reductase alpha subunit-like flavoprotein